MRFRIISHAALSRLGPALIVLRDILGHVPCTGPAELSSRFAETAHFMIWFGILDQPASLVRLQELVYVIPLL